MGLSKLSVVTTPLAIIELFEWHAHSSFKQIASPRAGVVAIDRMSRKEIGDFLARIWKDGEKEAGEVPDSHVVDKAPRVAIWKDCLLNTSFMEFHGLDRCINVQILRISTLMQVISGAA